MFLGKEKVFLARSVFPSSGPTPEELAQMERIETEKKVGSCYSLLLAFSLQWRRSRSRRAKSCGGGGGGGEKPALQATSCYAFNGMLSGYQ